MKHLLTCLMLLVALSLIALPAEAPSMDKRLDLKDVNNGLYTFQMGNNGKISQLVFKDLHKLVYGSATWVSGKRYRRDGLGRLLYWASYPPTNDTPLVYEGHPDWTPEMAVVLDSLTTVAFDGDMDLFEFLPAYNPLNIYNPDIPNNQYYSNQDIVLESVAGEPAPLDYNPFENETFCFSIPQPGSFQTPGFLTYSSYYYDYCPFSSPGDRDWGLSRASSTHYPLGLAVHQESYCWPVQDHDWMLINKYDVFNMDDTDTIRDLALSHYLDGDVGPVNWGVELAADDVSGYVKGAGYEFAYTRDADGDSGLSPYFIASKVVVPGFQEMGMFHNWFWRIGQGPDDRNPRDLSPYHITSNQKYWLATGRNPDTAQYTPLRPEDPDIMSYEQPTPNDTRFLYTHFGAQPGTYEYMETDEDGNYYKRLDLLPGQNLTYYVVLFVGNSIDDLKAKSLAIEAFVENDLIIDPSAGYTSIPFLRDPVNQAPDTFDLRWHNATPPSEYELLWKPFGAPATEWNVITLPGTVNSYSLSGMDPHTWYEIKVGAIFLTPTEVYLESETKLVNLTYTDVEDDILVPVANISNYPNPFRQHTTIEYQTKDAGQRDITIYNLKGQAVRSFKVSPQNAGKHRVDWDGKDNQGNLCSSGIYYLRITGGGYQQIRKMLMIK